MTEPNPPGTDHSPLPDPHTSQGFAPGFTAHPGPIHWSRTFFPGRWTQLIGPILFAGAAALLLAVIVITGGWLNLAASTPHPRGWATVLHYVFKRSTAHHAADLVVPADLGTPAMIAKGGLLRHGLRALPWRAGAGTESGCFVDDPTPAISAP